MQQGNYISSLLPWDQWTWTPRTSDRTKEHDGREGLCTVHSTWARKISYPPCLIHFSPCWISKTTFKSARS